jgi:hypothetical protein
MKGSYFGNERCYPEAEIERTEGVTLLDPAGRSEDTRVRVKKNRRSAVTPLSPPGESGEHVTSGSHESLTID